MKFNSIALPFGVHHSLFDILRFALLSLSHLGKAALPYPVYLVHYPRSSKGSAIIGKMYPPAGMTLTVFFSPFLLSFCNAVFRSGYHLHSMASGQVLQHFVPDERQVELLGHRQHEEEGHVEIHPRPLDERLAPAQFVRCPGINDAGIVPFDLANAVKKERRQRLPELRHYQDAPAQFGHHGRWHEGLHDLHAFIIGESGNNRGIGLTGYSDTQRLTLPLDLARNTSKTSPARMS